MHPVNKMVCVTASQIQIFGLHVVVRRESPPSLMHLGGDKTSWIVMNTFSWLPPVADFLTVM